MKRFAPILGLMTAMLVAACDVPEFDPPSRLTQDRVIAIKTEPREAAPGDTVTITGVAVTMDGEPLLEPKTWIVTGIASFSAGEQGEEIPAGELYMEAPGLPPFSFTVPENPNEFEQKFGIPYDPEGTVLTVAMAVGDLEDNPLLALKSFIVMDEPAKENPVFNKIDVLVDAKPTEPGGDGVTVVGNEGAIKLIADVDFPTRGDNVTFHWYTATKGMEFSVEKATEWRLPKKAGRYHAWCVARENSPSIIADGEVRIQSAGVDWSHAIIEVTSGE
ncbi:MAG: hypothetical protein IT350_01480 [Deltaproteobacteria bacterium]|nr:hypothetical protein [Deltaproteobacteria bacterium]